MKEKLKYSLGKASIVLLFIYYTLILTIGFINSVRILYNLNLTGSECNYIVSAIYGSISVGTMLCCVRYIRRLYKACIEDRIILSDIWQKHVGNLIYFLFRPIFATVFVMVMIYFLLSGMFIVTGSLDFILNEKFVYLCVILSSFLGYAIGDLIDKFEKISKSQIESWTSKENK